MADGAKLERDKTFLTKKLARELAEKYGTPLFVYDKKTLMEQTALIQNAFSWNPGHRTFLPVQSMNNPHLLRVIHQAGCGVLCANAVELRLAELAGIPGKDILFSSCFPSLEDWRAAIRSGATIILDHGEQLEDLHAVSYENQIIGLRLNAEGVIPIPGQLWGRQHTKLGMFKDELIGTAARAVERGFQGVGLYLTIGGSVCSPGMMGAVTKALFTLALELEQRLGIHVAWCDIGGGLVKDVDDTENAALHKEIQNIRLTVEKFHTAHSDWTEIPLFTELGQYAAAPAGVLLTRIVHMKHQDITYLGADMSSAHLPKCVYHGLSYHVSKVGDSRVEQRQVYHLAGTLPDPNDAMRKLLVLPPVKTGDLLLIHDVGANGRSISQSICGTLRCPEVLLDENGCHLIARRETFEDYATCLQGYDEQQQEHQQQCPKPQ